MPPSVTRFKRFHEQRTRGTILQYTQIYSNPNASKFMSMKFLGFLHWFSRLHRRIHRCHFPSTACFTQDSSSTGFSWAFAGSTWMNPLVSVKDGDELGFRSMPATSLRNRRNNVNTAGLKSLVNIAEWGKSRNLTGLHTHKSWQGEVLW